MQTAFRTTVWLGAGVSIDAYHMSDGTCRYGLRYVSQLFGHQKNYYSRLLKLLGTKKDPKKLKALLDKGFTGYKIAVKVLNDSGRGAAKPETISFDDFCLIADHEAYVDKNPKAQALYSASFRELLRSRTRNAFGLPEDTLEQKQLEFQFNYQHYLEDRAELNDLKLPGDEVYHPEFNELLGVSPWGIPYFLKEDLFPEYC
jgi:hypothetical protein